MFWRRVPGLSEFADLGLLPIRGMAWSGIDLIVVAADKVCRIDSQGGVKILRGELPGHSPVTIARNNNATPDIVVVSQTMTMIVGSDAISEYPDGNIAVPNSVSTLDGYLLFTYGDGAIRATNLNTAEMDGLSYAKAESNPDGLLRGVVSAQLFYAMGQASIEVFQDVGTSPFPLARVAVLPVGLIGPCAIAGAQQEGWDSKPIFVASDGTVRKLDGYQDSIISTSDVTRDILAQADKDNLIAQAYVVGETAMWSLSSPDWTWEFNAATNVWHQRKSHRLPRWRAAFSTFAFGRWLVGDTLSGRVLQVDGARRTELGEPLIFEVESDAVKSFPARMQCRRADFDFAVGYGSEIGLDPIEVDPVVAISWSDDGGASWSVPVTRQLGRQGQYRALVSVLNTGTAGPHGRKWRVVVSDPVECALMGGEMYTQVRVA